ncbi:MULTISPECIES: trifunctional serine/threonine-protein kinase/ATP-binding protein/sensor histidine kinase [Nostocales]|uniref:histidine kinase n=3 Tax=Nostocales TaxID=1161 RepID=A0A0C1R8E0_9CYAN|nr:AAA family ATPase [Tolypothrix bouteillei VB521301]
MKVSFDPGTTLPGYCLVEQLYFSAKTLVYRALREADQQRVIIKLLKREYPTVNELLQFRNQYNIAKNLPLSGVVSPYSLEPLRHGYALVMEDFGGVSLTEYTQGHPLELEEFLLIALQLADILQGLYQHRVIHKDLKPANVLIHPQTKQIKLIDFSIASVLRHETQTLQNPNGIEGTLAYLSPEQTGRMNRGIDYRSDFYSLGVTFFELLTGQLPFQSNDPMELVYSHIAKQAPAVHNINPDIPLVLSAIVRKLMAKNAEDRYQSASGLLADLQRCVTEFKINEQISNFEVGQLDASAQLNIPQKLYGREQQVKQLLAAFTRVACPEDSSSSSRSELVLVSGYSGIGKSSLVHEVHKPIVRKRGYFISGKFDQFKRNIPYASLIQAFQSLMRQLLTEDTHKLQNWQEKLKRALGENGQVIVDVIPELEAIVGKQPSIEELRGTEAQNRFNRVFQAFIEVFTQPEHPLVLFLDDLQWADSASLNLIQVLMSNPESKHLLLIGAYRDNEISATHPLMKMLDVLHKANTAIENIVLYPLEIHYVRQLVADTLNDRNRSVPLAELLFNISQGNPFFLTQLLKSLYQEHLLTFDFTRGCWMWDLEQIQRVGITNKNVVELVALNLQKLPNTTQTILQLAACIGNRFNLDILATVSNTSLLDTAKALQPSLQAGFILPLNNNYQVPLLFSSEELDEFGFDVSVSYRFLHDRVQQAAYSLIPQTQKQATHLEIGQLLLRNTPPEAIENYIFDIVNQLNFGRDLLTQISERQELAQLNLIAGRKGKAAAAYEPAFKYFTVGIALLSADSWQTHYSLTLKLYEEAAEAALLCGEFELMEQLVLAVLQQAQTLLDKIKVYEVKVLACVAQSKQPQAIKTALTVAELFGVAFPEQPNQTDIAEGLQKTQDTLAEKQLEDLLELPEMRDLRALALVRILASVTAAVYQAVPTLLPLIVFKQVRLSVKYGNASVSAQAYAWYGVILCGVIGNIEEGNRVGQLALGLLSKLKSKEFRASTINMVYPFVKPWKYHIQKSLDPLLDGYHCGLETGALEYAAYCAYNYCSLSFFLGKELSILEEEMKAYSHALAQLKQEVAHNYLRVFYQSVLNLLGQSKHPWEFKGTVYHEDKMLPLHHTANDRYAIGTLYVNKLILCYLFQEWRQATKVANLAGEYLDGVSGSFTIPVFSFYDALTQLAILPEIEESKQELVWERAIANRNKLEHWANYAPMNHLHKFYLVEAERYRVLGRIYEAMEYYDRAITGAIENHYFHEAALANERAAEFYFSLKKNKIAQAYITEAYHGYQQWGAKAKVQQLEEFYFEWLNLNSQKLSKEDSSLSKGSTTSKGEVFDLIAVMKASQAISSEIVLDRLLENLLHIILENAAAQKGCIILERDNQLFIEVADTNQHELAVVLQSIPVKDSQDVPVSIIEYVRRTQQPLVLNNATEEAISKSDAYIVYHEPQSILCAPILYQGKFIGIIYLENNLATGVFTHNRVEILNFLCTQAAISLENARLYQQAQNAVAHLQQTQLQLVQSEKMSALGNLVAGVAHEINNPIGFIAGNIDPAQEYVQDLCGLLDLYREKFPHPGQEIEDKIETIDLEYLRQDLPKLIESMKLGVERICNISTSLRTFSRSDKDYKVPFNIHEGIESTLLILKHRLKANDDRPAINVIKDYGDIPQVECFPGQLNQVFMNLLANAIDALEESNMGSSFEHIRANPNCITIQTAMKDEQHIMIRIADNGIGMTEQVKQIAFDYLFTTKAVGHGTGLGLAIAHQIVVERHGGTIEINSVLGQGAEFAIVLPISSQ